MCWAAKCTYLCPCGRLKSHVTTTWLGCPFCYSEPSSREWCHDTFTIDEEEVITCRLCKDELSDVNVLSPKPQAVNHPAPLAPSDRHPTHRKPGSPAIAEEKARMVQIPDPPANYDAVMAMKRFRESYIVGINTAVFASHLELLRKSFQPLLVFIQTDLLPYAGKLRAEKEVQGDRLATTMDYIGLDILSLLENAERQLQKVEKSEKFLTNARGPKIGMDPAHVDEAIEKTIDDLEHMVGEFQGIRGGDPRIDRVRFEHFIEAIIDRLADLGYGLESEEEEEDSDGKDRKP